jgi:hypothetical protein
MNLGTVVCEGLTFRITTVHLVNSGVLILAERPGPVPAMSDAIASIFGSDGKGICQLEKKLSIGATRRDEIAVVRCTLKVETVA